MKKLFIIITIIFLVIGLYLVVKFPVGRVMAIAKFNKFKTEYRLNEDDYEIMYFGYDLFKNDAYMFHIVYKDDPNRTYRYVFDLFKNKFKITIVTKGKYVDTYEEHPYPKDVLFPFDEYRW